MFLLGCCLESEGVVPMDITDDKVPFPVPVPGDLSPHSSGQNEKVQSPILVPPKPISSLNPGSSNIQKYDL